VKRLEAADKQTDSHSLSFSAAFRVLFKKILRIALSQRFSELRVEFLDVDGSYGEGGGQILRTALAFSTITRRPVRVSKIRAGRDVPGLRRQHVSSLRVLGAVFDSKLDGVAEGSSEVSFVPGLPRAEYISLDMKTAASITLVLQAVIPAVALTHSRLTLELVGGTDVPWSPTFDYFDSIVRIAYGAIGIKFSARAVRRGYYPRGGGQAVVKVEPCEALRPLQLVEQPRVEAVDLTSRYALLPRHVAERQLGSAVAALEEKGFRIERKLVAEEQADSPGSSVLVSSSGDSFFLGADKLGARGCPSEEVGRAAAERFASLARSGACVDDNLADMLAPLLSLASGPSALRVARVSKHLDAGVYIAKLFSSCEYNIREEGQGAVVAIRPG
jgi:RNA 3'-phosphate cyclase